LKSKILILKVELRINPGERQSTYDSLVSISKYLQDLEFLRIATCTISEQVLNTVVEILNHNEFISCLEIYSCEFLNNSFDMISKSIMNSNLYSIHIDKIAFSEDSFGFFTNCLNKCDAICSLTMKRLEIPYECLQFLEKLIIENQNIKFFELSISKSNANKIMFYSNILEILSQNHILSSVKLEDYQIEKEDIVKLNRIYQSRHDLENPIHLSIGGYNLTNDYLLNIYEIYLKYSPKLQSLFKINFGNYTLIYNSQESRAELEIRTLSCFEEYEKFVQRYNIEHLIFKIEKYENLRNFFIRLREKDCFKDIKIYNLNEQGLFLDFLSEYLYMTRNLQTLYIDSTNNLIRVEKTILLAIQNNRSSKIRLIINDLEFDEIQGIVSYLSEKSSQFDIKCDSLKQFKSSKSISLIRGVENSQKLLVTFI
jgi:hypothetical protein